MKGIMVDNKEFRTDYKRMTEEEYHIGIKSFIKMLLRHQIGYMYWWRSNKRKKSILKKWIIYCYTRKYGLEISEDAVIGSGLYLGHPYNITVGGGTIIGEHVNLHKGCTIGRENRGVREGTPVIGDNVWIGINATVVGKIKIGNDVMICPNSFVNIDVPEHSIVIGNPAVIHSKENATYKYL